MAYATVTIPGDGVTTLITASFALGEISREHTTVRVSGEVDGAGNPVYRTFTRIGSSQFQVNGTPAPVGQFYIIERRVPKTELLVDWEDDDPITEANLNTSQKQSLMVAQEALDAATFAVRTKDNTEGPEITRGPVNTVPIWNSDGDLVVGPSTLDITAAADNAALAKAYRDAAFTYSNNALSYANAAASARDTAQTHRDAAYLWANAAEDTVVTDGPHTGYSAYHWAEKAAEIAAGISGYTKAEIDAQQSAQNTAIGNKADKNVTISASGLATGGGSLSTNRTIDVPKSTNAQALAGTDDSTAMTPVRTKEAILAYSPQLFTPTTVISLSPNNTRLNSRAVPILVVVRIDMPNTSSTIDILVRVGDSLTAASNPLEYRSKTSMAANDSVAISFIVPPGKYYSYSFSPVGTPVITEKG